MDPEIIFNLEDAPPPTAAEPVDDVGVIVNTDAGLPYPSVPEPEPSDIVITYSP